MSMNSSCWIFNSNPFTFFSIWCSYEIIIFFNFPIFSICNFFQVFQASISKFLTSIQFIYFAGQLWDILTKSFNVAHFGGKCLYLWYVQIISFIHQKILKEKLLQYLVLHNSQITLQHFLLNILYTFTPHNL